MKIKTQDDENYHPLEENKNVYLSGFKGLEITFHDGVNKIMFKGSLYTGKEEVLINNQIVSKKRTFRKATKHHFQFNGNEYIIEYIINNLFKLTWTCSLFRNGALIKEVDCRNIQSEQRFLKKHPEFVFGGLIGVALALGYIPLYMVLVIVLVGSISSLWYTKRFFLVRESVRLSS